MFGAPRNARAAAPVSQRDAAAQRESQLDAALARAAGLEQELMRQDEAVAVLEQVKVRAEFENPVAGMRAAQPALG